MDATAIEANAQARHTAHHFSLKAILIVSTLMGIAGMNAAQAVGTVPKLNYDYAAADASCKSYNAKTLNSSETFNLHPTGLRIGIVNSFFNYGAYFTLLPISILT